MYIMPAHTRSHSQVAHILPFLAAFITWLYIAASMWYAVVQVTHTIQTGQERETQAWSMLKPIEAEMLARLQIVRQNFLLSRVTSVAFSSSGRYLAAGSDLTGVMVVETASNRPIRWLPGNGVYILDVAFAPGENVIVASEAEGLIRLWEISKGTLLRLLHGHTAEVNSVSFHPQGNWLASGGSDATVLVWEWEQGQIIRTEQMNGIVSVVAFSPNGDWLATGDLTGQVWLLDVEQDEPVCQWFQAGGVTDLRFTPDSTHVYAAGSTAMSSWRTSDCAPTTMLETPNQEPLSKIAVSPDGRLLAGVGGAWREPRLWVWSLPEGVLLLSGKLPARVEALRDVVFDPSGRVFLTASHDGYLRWWGQR
ncbi:MAG: hypothetical protein DDG60_00095 [Anaerolineae bacterium]|nr:MAG: hypothetical protein DDG60_00095 [Anaerolineae bacterium]